MRKFMMMVVLCMATCTLWAQNEVSSVVSGEGKDKEEATLKALRGAIEQAYGTFVSANTTLFDALPEWECTRELLTTDDGQQAPVKKYKFKGKTISALQVYHPAMPNGKARGWHEFLYKRMKRCGCLRHK